MDRLSFSFKHPKLVPGGLFASSSSRKRFSKNDDDDSVCSLRRRRLRRRPFLYIAKRERERETNAFDDGK